MSATKLQISLVFLLVAVFTGPAFAQKTRPELQKDLSPEVTGVVQSVDAGKGTISLVSKLSGLRTFDVAKDTRVYLDDGTGGKLGFTNGTLGDVAEGLTVTVRLSENGKSATAMWVEGPSVRGVVKYVSFPNHTVTVTMVEGKEEGARDQTFALSPRVTVTLLEGRKDKGEVEAKAVVVPLGCIVTLKLSADRKVVGGILAEGPEVQGIVKAVDGGKNTLTLAVNAKGQHVELTFTIPPSASLALGSVKEKGRTLPQMSKLADLPVGALVTLKMSLDQKQVVSVATQSVTLAGTVKAVDAARNSITVAVGGTKTEPAEEKTYDISPDASVRIDGRSAKLTDVPPDAIVTLRMFADNKTVGAINAEGPHIGGTVKMVDANARTVTLAAGKGGEEQTLAVRQDAPITIDGKAGALADVPADAQVGGTLTVDRKSFVMLQVTGPSLEGLIKSVDVAKGTIAINVTRKGGVVEERVFELAKNVTVASVNGKTLTPLKLGELKVGHEVNLQLSADQKTVLAIRVIG